MVYQESQLKNIAYNFVRRLNKKIPVEMVILFGSYAWGHPQKNSDIDLAVISSRFEKMDDIKRIMLLSDVARKIKTPSLIDIDPLGFTEEELNNADYFDIAAEIKEKGKVIYQNKFCQKR